MQGPVLTEGGWRSCRGQIQFVSFFVKLAIFSRGSCIVVSHPV